MTGATTYDVTFVFREAGRADLVIAGAKSVVDLPAGQIPPSVTRVERADGVLVEVNWADVSYRVLKTVPG